MSVDWPTVIASVFIGYLIGGMHVGIIWVRDQQREDRRWRCWQPTEKELKE